MVPVDLSFRVLSVPPAVVPLNGILVYALGVQRLWCLVRIESPRCWISGRVDFVRRSRRGFTAAALGCSTTIAERPPPSSASPLRAARLPLPLAPSRSRLFPAPHSRRAVQVGVVATRHPLLLRAKLDDKSLTGISASVSPPPIMMRSTSRMCHPSGDAVVLEGLRGAGQTHEHPRRGPPLTEISSS
jgi:hypothetical protein